MGSVPWKGQALHAGFSITIAGKEVELDVAVPASQLPTMSGHEKISADSPSTNDMVLDAVEPRASKHFVAPASFYATTPKPKAKGPRCVAGIYFCLASS
jgi:hypothetical protein